MTLIPHFKTICRHFKEDIFRIIKIYLRSICKKFHSLHFTVRFLFHAEKHLLSLSVNLSVALHFQRNYGTLTFLTTIFHMVCTWSHATLCLPESSADKIQHEIMCLLSRPRRKMIFSVGSLLGLNVDFCRKSLRIKPPIDWHLFPGGVGGRDQQCIHAMEVNYNIL